MLGRSPRPLRPLTALLLLLAGWSLGLQPVHALAPDGLAPVQQQKKLSLDELLTIEVTSVSKRPEKLLEAASAIQVITHEDIRRSGATSIPEALRLADNLDVAQKNAHEWAISARGFNTDLANKLLVLMDGRTVYTPLFSGVFWDIQDYLLDDLDRIEVISGPGGTLWGANAVNGVINILSKEARETQGFFSEAGAGDSLHQFFAARYGGQLAPHVYFRVYGKYFDRDRNTTADGHPATDAWRKNQGGFRLDADPSPENTFTLQGDTYAGREELVGGGHARTRGGNLLGRWSHVLPSGSDFSLQAYHDRTHLALDVPALAFAPAGVLVDDLDTYDLDFQHRFARGDRHRFVWGLGYRQTHDVVGNAPSLSLFPARLDQRLFSGFAQDEVTLPHDLVLTLGSKIEHNDYTGLELEPSVRLQWAATPLQTFWTAVSRAVRTPSRLDRDLSEPAPGYTLVVLRGSKDFTSEALVAYEAGWRTALGERATASLSVFANRYDHIRSTTASPADPVFHLPFPFYFENNLAADTQGLEFTASYQLLSWWQLHAGYRALAESVRIAPGRTDFNRTLNEVADPGQQASLRSAMDLPGNTQFDAHLRWTDNREINNAGVAALVPSYFELDLRLGWHPSPNLELSLTGQNLLHARHLEYGVPAPGRAEIERSFYGKVTWRF